MINQEILFRGFHPCEDGDTAIYVEGEAVKGWWLYGGYWLNNTVTRQTPHIIDSDGASFNVIPSTVCQYTGLNDKNGRKIFKGDICDVTVFAYDGSDTQHIGDVIYDNACFFVGDDSRLMKSREYLKKVLAERLTKSPKEELQCKR